MKKIISKSSGETSFLNTAFGVLPRSKVVELEAEGVAKGLTYLFKIAPKKPRITALFLIKLHKTCFGFLFPKWAGKLRTINVKVSEHIPPSPHKLRECLVNFERDLEEQLKYLPRNKSKRIDRLIEIAAWLQHKIVWIHPFNDYNGRIARLATNLFFLEHGFPLVEIPAEKSDKIRKKYVKAMQEADKGNLLPLIKLFKIALKDTKYKI